MKENKIVMSRHLNSGHCVGRMTAMKRGESKDQADINWLV